MKKIYSYSENKFTSFSRKKQIAIIQEMLAVLEKNFNNEVYASALKNSIEECFTYLEGSDNNFPISYKNYDISSYPELLSLRDEFSSYQGEFLRDSDIIVRRYDSLNIINKKFPLVLILDSLRSAFNVGAIIRSSECLGVREIALCGKTPQQDNRKVIETAMGTTDFVKLVNFRTIEEAISAYRKENYEISALELTNTSISLEAYQPAAKVALIVGNESLGISEETLSICDKIIEISMHGQKNSLNVSNATAIAIYNIINKMEVNHDK
ncbi:hypothetical protein JEZ13_02820 [bacterium]|nr:hypothetical protein [bacterium]